MTKNKKIDFLDNSALNILCYNPEYTFVEKLQTISTKYRLFRSSNETPANFLRHYYDIFCLLNRNEIIQLIGTEKYEGYKRQRFRNKDEICIAKNEAFTLKDAEQFNKLKELYKKTTALYYAGQPELSEIIDTIKKHIDKL